MFLRQKIRNKDGKRHRYWSVVENKRVAGGRVVQKHVLHLGEINDSQELAWRRSIEVLDEAADRPKTLSLFPEDRCEGIAAGRLDRSVEALAASASVGRGNGAPAGWRCRCGRSCSSIGSGPSGCRRAARARVGIRNCSCWSPIACSAGPRAATGGNGGCIGNGSSGRRWPICWAADFGLAEIHKLYRCHDRLLEHKQALFDHLTGRWRDLFNARFDLLLYDLTSTYFEAEPPFPEGDKRRFGYSRDHRPDCVQVVIALVVTPEGLPLAYEVLSGNTSDKTTLRDFLAKIERQYGKARRIWLMDRGIPTEEVLAEMRQADPPVRYLVGTPKGRLTRLERDLSTKPWQEARPGVQVKLLPQDGELYVFAQSLDRVAKERSMRRRQLKGLWARLKDLRRMSVNLTRDELLIKLGQAKAKWPTGWRLVEVEVDAKLAAFRYALDRKKLRQARRREGRYLLRSNLTEGDPATLWSYYLQLGPGGGSVPKPEGRPRHPADPSSGAGAHRGPHLHRLPGLLPARHHRPSPERTGARA